MLAQQKELTQVEGKAGTREGEAGRAICGMKIGWNRMAKMHPSQVADVVGAPVCGKRMVQEDGSDGESRLFR